MYAKPPSSLQSALRSVLRSAIWKIPNYEKLSWIFFHFKSFLKFIAELQRINILKLIMTEVSRNWRNIFFLKNNPDFETPSRIFVR